MFKTVNEVNFKPRVQTASKASTFAQVGETNRAGKNVVIVPGHDGKRYQTILHRMKIAGVPVVHAECLIYTDRGTPGACQGNHASVCYHAMAAVIATAGLQDKSVAFCHNQQDAMRLKNLTGGTVFAIVSKQSGRAVWAVSK